MATFLGIDGGGTSTRALLCDASGRVRGTGVAGISNYHHAGWAGAAQAVATAVAAARAAAGGDEEPLTAAFLGLAAVATPEARARWRTLALQQGWGPAEAAIGVDHDLRIALAGGLAGRHGIVVIAGTGSASFGCNACGATWQAGGWGSLLDDGGGGYWLGVQALAAAARAEDGRGPATTLGERSLARLAVPTLREATTRLLDGSLARHQIAQVALDAMEAATAGDGVAQRLLERGATELALMAGAVARRVFPDSDPEIVVAGGAGQHAGYAPVIAGALAREVPGGRIVAAELPPVAGAAVLALRLAGQPTGAETVARLRAGLSG